MANKTKKQIPGVDYEAYNGMDAYGLRWNEPKFIQHDAMGILWRGVWDRRITKVLENPGKVFVDELTRHEKAWRRGEWVNVTKGYYGKARIVHIESKSGRVYEILISYNTAVCMLDSNGRFIRLWNGYSATTAKHIDTFRNRYGLGGIGKGHWLELPIGKWDGTAQNAIA